MVGNYIKTRQHKDFLLGKTGPRALVAIFCGLPQKDMPALEGWGYFEDLILYAPLEKLTPQQMKDTLFAAFDSAARHYSASNIDVRCDLAVAGGGVFFERPVSIINFASEIDRPNGSRQKFDEMIDRTVMPKASAYLKREVA